MSVQVFSPFGQTEGERKAFFKQLLVVIRDKKSLSFCESQNNLTLPLLFIQPPYKVITAGHGVVKLVDRF